MSFTPLHDRVLVRRIEGDAKTSGGLIIPDTAKEKPQEGEIVAVGAGAKDEDGERIAMDVKAGDRILFGKCVNGGVKTSHAAAQNQASGGAPSAMARALAR